MKKTLPLVATLRKISGAVILGAIADSPATAAGLRAGDVIYEINNRTVRNLRDLMDAARELTENRTVVLHVERSGQFVEVDID